MMQYWLVKTEPTTYSWEQFVADGVTPWTGVRNYGARNNIRDMHLGDQVFVYHSSTSAPAIVGIGIVATEAYQDPTTDESAWLCVDLAPVKPLSRPVTLEEIKKLPSLAEMALVKRGRLSVQPVTTAEYKQIIALSNQKTQNTHETPQPKTR